MIPRNSRLPCGTKKQFITNVDTPQSIVIRLLQGEAREIAACTYIGDVRISKLPKALPAGSPVEIVYSYDHRGHITVAAKELVGGGSAAVEIAWDGALDNQAIDKLRQLAQQYHVE